MAKRTITLSDRRPVTIEEDNWSVIAKASDEEHDGQVRCQANRVSNWSIRVRENDGNAEHDGSGKVIVSATYSYTSNWQGARCYSAKHGEMLMPTKCDQDGENRQVDPAEIVAAIKRVCDRMAACECDGDDAARWGTLCDECIADLPAEEV